MKESSPRRGGGGGGERILGEKGGECDENKGQENRGTVQLLMVTRQKSNKEGRGLINTGRGAQTNHLWKKVAIEIETNPGPINPFNYL